MFWDGPVLDPSWTRLAPAAEDAKGCLLLDCYRPGPPMGIFMSQVIEVKTAGCPSSRHFAVTLETTNPSGPETVIVEGFTEMLYRVVDQLFLFEFQVKGWL